MVYTYVNVIYFKCLICYFCTLPVKIYNYRFDNGLIMLETSAEEMK